VGELILGNSRGCFLATIHAGETMRQLRRGIRELGRHAALPVWVAEHEAGETVEAGLGRSDLVIFLIDGSFDRAASAAHVEFELLQATLLRKRGVVIVVDDVDPPADRLLLLDLIALIYPRRDWHVIGSHAKAFDIVARTVRRQRSYARQDAAEPSPLSAAISEAFAGWRLGLGLRALS
jgi:hypothetical protein